MSALCRYRDAKGRTRLGLVQDEMVQPLLGDLFGEYEITGTPTPLDEVHLLAPVKSSKVIGIGSNYKKHIEEMGRPTPAVPKIFIKPSTSIIGPNTAIELPPGTERVDHEAEVGVVISRWTSRVSEEDALQYILGYTCVNDVTARDFQRQDGVFGRAKGFDTFCPIGPWIVPTQEDLPRRVRCYVNDELRQDGNTADLLFPITKLISFVSHVMTLVPGDIISTGTPSGVGALHPGDRVVVDVEGIGRLMNPVVDRSDRYVR